jgi:hypothetical protein
MFRRPFNPRVVRSSGLPGNHSRSEGEVLRSFCFIIIRVESIPPYAIIDQLQPESVLTVNQ